MQTEEDNNVVEPHRVNTLKGATIKVIATLPSKRLKMRKTRVLAVEKTSISSYRLETAQQVGLLLPTKDGKEVFDEIERDRQVKIIGDMTIPMENKRRLRFGSLP